MTLQPCADKWCCATGWLLPLMVPAGCGHPHQPAQPACADLLLQCNAHGSHAMSATQWAPREIQGKAIPSSLRNMYKELKEDLGCEGSCRNGARLPGLWPGLVGPSGCASLWLGAGCGCPRWMAVHALPLLPMLAKHGYLEKRPTHLLLMQL